MALQRGSRAANKDVNPPMITLPWSRAFDVGLRPDIWASRAIAIGEGGKSSNRSGPLSTTHHLALGCRASDDKNLRQSNAELYLNQVVLTSLDIFHHGGEAMEHLNIQVQVGLHCGTRGEEKGGLAG